MNDAPRFPSDWNESRSEGTPVERWLDEAVEAERNAPPVDADRFIARLRARLLVHGAGPLAPRSPLGRALAVAAMIPIALGLWLLIGGPGTAPNPSDRSVEEVALIEELDLLLILDELSPAEIEAFDPELIDLYQNLEVLEDLPVELLEDEG